MKINLNFDDASSIISNIDKVFFEKTIINELEYIAKEFPEYYSLEKFNNSLNDFTFLKRDKTIRFNRIRNESLAFKLKSTLDKTNKFNKTFYPKINGSDITIDLSEYNSLLNQSIELAELKNFLISDGLANVDFFN